jgi:hypothetical protein
MINGMRIFSLALFFGAALACCQNTSFEAHPAISLSNDKLEVLVLKQGASVASVILRDDPSRLSPLWDPARMAREATGRSNFNSGTGQFLCVDGFGGVSNEERLPGSPATVRPTSPNGTLASKGANSP